MFVVLDGGLDVLLPSLSGRLKTFGRHRRNEFSGELSLLNSQRSVAEVRTTFESRLLRISRKDLRLLMRAEGDIANIICVRANLAAHWDQRGSIERHCARACACDADLMHLQRFFVQNYQLSTV